MVQFDNVRAMPHGDDQEVLSELKNGTMIQRALAAIFLHCCHAIECPGRSHCWAQLHAQVDARYVFKPLARIYDPALAAKAGIPLTSASLPENGMCVGY
jgi:hypothetical protein